MHFPRPHVSLVTILLSISPPSAATTGRYSWSIPPRERTVVAKINTPGVPLWVWNETNAVYDLEPGAESAILLNFTLTHDNKTLLVNDEPYLTLPLKEPTTAPRISAYQVPQSLTSQNTLDGRQRLEVLGACRSTNKCRCFGLSYERSITPRDDPNIRYYNPVFEVRLDVIGLSADNDRLLTDVQSQGYVNIQMKHLHGGSSESEGTQYSLTRLSILNRDKPGPRPSEEGCDRLSWRCADMGDPPWWRRIWRHQFDEYGRVGSLRHALTKRWAEKQLLEVLLAVLLLCGLLYQIVRMSRRSNGVVRHDSLGTAPASDGRLSKIEEWIRGVSKSRRDD